MKYEIDQLLELSAQSVSPPKEVLDFCEQFQQVADILAQREARKLRKKLPKEVTDEDGWTSFVKHEEETEETETAPLDDGFSTGKKSKGGAAAPMKVKTSASKMTRGGNGAGDNITITQTKAFNAFAALGGEDDDDDDEDDE